MRNRLLGVGVAALAVAFAPGCGSSDKGKGTTPNVTGNTGAVPTVNEELCDARGKSVETFDLDGDDRPEVWKLSDDVDEGGVTRRVLTCKQSDLNLDGRQDYVVAYTPHGSLDWESFDFDFDGQFDALYLYAPRKDDRNVTHLVEVYRSSRFDGNYDLKEVYDEDGALTQVQRVVGAECLGDKRLHLLGEQDDPGSKGVEPNVWENYEEGELVAILYDDDCDKRVDRREEIQQGEDATATAAIDGGDDEDGPDAEGDEPGDDDTDDASE